MNENEYGDDYGHPCYDCPQEDYCDGWEAQFCCLLCHWYGNEHCDDCDPWDI